MAGSQFSYLVQIDEPGVHERSAFHAGFAEWRDGAVVMTRAVPSVGNPNEPVAHLVVVPVAGTVVVIRYLGEPS